MHRLQELVRLHRMGVSPRQVAKTLAMGPNTERRYRKILAGAGLLAGEPDDLPELAVLRSAVEAEMAPIPPPQEVSSVAEWQGDACTRAGLVLGPSTTGSAASARRFPAATRRSSACAGAWAKNTAQARTTWRFRSTSRPARLRSTSATSAFCTTR